MRWLGVLFIWFLVTPVRLSAQRAAVSDSGRTHSYVSIVEAASLTGREDIAVRSHVVPGRVYVGQQATYEVGVFLSDETRSRMRRNPEFIPPEMRTMLAYDLGAPATVPARIVDGQRYEVHVFRRALFPLAAGALEIPPAKLNYALPLSTSFFSREETHTERTQASTLDVLEPPTAGRPRDYSGAVGQLALDARIENRSGRVGDPLLLTLTVSGIGNVSLAPPPLVSLNWGDAVAGAERTRVDTSGALVRGRKEFDYLLTPRRDGILTVPAIAYVYFDPYIEEYRTASSASIAVTIAPSGVPVTAGTVADSLVLLPIRRAYSGDASRPLSASMWYWMSIALAPLPALLLAMRRRPSSNPAESPVARIAAMVASGSVDPSALRRDYARALADRIPGSGSFLSNHVRLARILRRAGVSPETAADASRLLAEMDASVFGRSPAPPTDRGIRAHRLLQAIDDEALPREEIPRIPLRLHSSVFVGMALVATGAGVSIAADSATEFQTAVAAYDARDLGRARALFENVARQHPRAADAWANAGSVAWQMGDTASAAANWQRALRLDPLAEDVRGYLESTPGFDSSVFGDVPAIPLSFLAGIGALLWFGAWGTLATAPSRPVRRQAAAGLAACALVVGMAGLHLNDVFSGRHAAIVLHGDRLRSAPTLAAESGAEVIPGELAHAVGTQTAWTRVRLRGDRNGWIESRKLESLELRR
ncbi:MAG: hypothetical protein MNPFHGCM_01541 [Gemmatimonadaceae bacterium]|nr:hypothetical protein [Gemmatimonadaceae bacterium]